jgi:hypothetical protein
MKIHGGLAALSIVGSVTLFAAVLAAAAGTAQNLVINGDFENGNTGFTTGYAMGNVNGPGTYTIGTNPSAAPGAYGDWCNCGDHTTGAGNMMIVNGANNASWPVWEETVTVTPSTEYVFSYWAAEVDHDSNSVPHLLVRINGRVTGNSYLPKNSPDNGGRWQNYRFRWNSGTSQKADLAIFDQNTETAWNDFALDDISFTVAPPPPAAK